MFLFKHIFDCFVERDCDLIEINPLVLTTNGHVLAADSKITIDDNAIFRQTEIKSEEDTSQHNYKERIAHSFNLNYIYIGGNIGCLVNGAGLAMATMDIIKHYGGNPANFLDVGGSAEDEQMVEAIKLLNNDPEVDAIFINIFGGILRCDNLANSIIKAAEDISLTKPIVLRLKGTNSDKAREMIKPREKELGIYFDDSFDSAARLVVDVALRQREREWEQWAAGALIYEWHGINGLDRVPLEKRNTKVIYQQFHILKSYPFHILGFVKAPLSDKTFSSFSGIILSMSTDDSSSLWFKNERETGGLSILILFKIQYTHPNTIY